MEMIFKPETLIFQIKANSAVKIVFGKITHHFEPEVRKMLVRKVHGNDNSIFHCHPCFNKIVSLRNGI